MKKVILIFIIFIFCLPAYGQNKTTQINKTKSKIQYVTLKQFSKTTNMQNKKLNDLKERYSSLLDLNNNIRDDIVNTLMLVGLVIAVFSSALGIYIGFKAKQVKKIYGQSKEISDNLNNNLDKVYNDLKKEEFKNLIKRLKIIPQDILHHTGKFIGGDLPDNYYSDIKEIYFKLKAEKHKHQLDIKNVVRDSINTCLLILYQHYIADAIADDEIFKDMQNKYHFIFQLSYDAEFTNYINVYRNKIHCIFKISTTALTSHARASRLVP